MMILNNILLIQKPLNHNNYVETGYIWTGYTSMFVSSQPNQGNVIILVV